MKYNFVKLIGCIIFASVVITYVYYNNPNSNSIIVHSNSTTSDIVSDTQTTPNNSSVSKESSTSNAKSSSKTENSDAVEDSSVLDEYDELVTSSFDANSPQEDYDFIYSSSTPSLNSNSSSNSTSSSTPNSNSSNNSSQSSTNNNQQDSSSEDNFYDSSDNDVLHLEKEIEGLKQEIRSIYPVSISTPNHIKDDNIATTLKSSLLQIKETLSSIDSQILNGLKSKSCIASISLVVPNTARLMGFTNSYEIKTTDQIEISIYSILIDMCDQILKNSNVYSTAVADYTALNPDNFTYGLPSSQYVNELYFLNMLSQQSLQSDRLYTFMYFKNIATSDQYKNTNSYNKYLVMENYYKSYVY